MCIRDRVEIDYKAKNPKIYNMFGFPTPPGMINDGVVQPDGMFRSILYSKPVSYTHLDVYKRQAKIL